MSIRDMLDAFESALDRESVEYEPLISAFRVVFATSYRYWEKLQANQEDAAARRRASPRP